VSIIGRAQTGAVGADKAATPNYLIELTESPHNGANDLDMGVALRATGANELPDERGVTLDAGQRTPLGTQRFPAFLAARGDHRSTCGAMAIPCRRRCRLHRHKPERLHFLSFRRRWRLQ